LHENHRFPISVQKVNPGIVTVSDYIKKVNGGKSVFPAAIVLIAVFGFLLKGGYNG